MINLEEISYKKFGKCLRISNGKIEVTVTLEIGPRIIRFSSVGGENVFFEDDRLTINHNAKKDVYAEKYGEEMGVWATVGGHRLWAAPEALPRSYYPQCSSIYEKIEGGARIIAPVQKWTNLQPEFDITVIGDNEVKVVNRWRNCGAWPTEFAVWCISVADKGGVEIIPQAKRKGGLLNNRLIALWDYSDMADERVNWGSKYIRLRQDENIAQSFKFGTDSDAGYALYFNKGDLFVKKFDIVEGGNYPDGGMNFESYTCGAFLEIESLGELKTVESGGVSEHTEYWKIINGVSLPESDDEIDDIVKRYV